MFDHPLIIVGGSIAGLATANALWNVGVKSVVLDAGAHDVSVRGAGMAVDLHLLASVTRGRAPLPAYIDYEARAAVLPRSAQRPPPPGAQSTSWAEVRRSLRLAFPGEYRVGVFVKAIAANPGGAVLVETDGGQTLAAAVVVVANGYRSAFRSLVAPDRPEPGYAGYILWRGLLASDQVPDGSLRVHPGSYDGLTELSHHEADGCPA